MCPPVASGHHPRFCLKCKQPGSADDIPPFCEEALLINRVRCAPTYKFSLIVGFFHRDCVRKMTEDDLLEYYPDYDARRGPRTAQQNAQPDIQQTSQEDDQGGSSETRGNA